MLLSSPLLSQNHTYTQYTTEDGLPTDYVYGVIEDDDGYIWAYTENGIAKFDGYNWKVFTTADGLPHNDVYHMLKDKDGRLWCRNIGNVACYVQGDSIVKPVGDVPSYLYPALVDGYPYAGFDTNSWQLLHFKSGTEVDTIDYPKEVIDMVLYLYETGEMISLPSIPHDSGWSGYTMTHGVLEAFFFEEGKDIEFTKDPFAPLYSRIIRHPHRYVQGDFIGFKSDSAIFLSKVGSGIHRKLDYTDLGYSPAVDSPLDNIKGELVFNTNREYVFLDDSLEVDSRFQPDDISANYSLRRLYIDSENNRWIGTKEGGLFMIPQQNLKTTHIPLIEEKGRLVLSYEEIVEFGEKIYVISDDLQVYELLDETLHWRMKLAGQQLKQATVIDDRLLIANSDPLVQLGMDKGKLSHLSDNYPIARILNGRRLRHKDFLNEKRNIKSFARDEATLFYCAGSFINALNTDKNELSELKELKSRCLHYDSANERLLLDSMSSLCSYTEGAFEVLYTFPDIISEIHSLNENEVLVATENAGIYCYSIDSTYRLSMASYAKSFVLLGDSIYAATKEGVVELVRNESHFWEESSRIDMNDGLPSLEVHDIHIIDRQIYGATYKGVFKFNLDHGIYAPTSTRKLRFNHLAIGNKRYSADEEQSFPHHTNELHVRYHFNDYASNGDILYSYRLKPIEEKFRTSTEREAIYAGLSPGHYEFEVFATDIYGQTYLQEMPVSFEIRKPWWKTTPLILLYFLAAGGFLYWLLRQREQAITIRFEKEQALNKRVDELRLESLRSQMNPHFIFNSLSSIQYYIQTSKVDEADYYLTLFAQLMRDFLDCSIESTISLDKELELLKKYTQLERMRFDEAFSVNFDIDENIIPGERRIPSMIIQPFIENAVNHGLRQRKEGGLLTIRIEDIAEGLLVYVEDNGVGRDNSKAYQSPEKHKSRALQNIHERIDVIRKTGVKIELEFDDLSPNHEYPGTQVKLRLTRTKGHE